MLLSVERFSEIYIVLKITGVRVPTSVRVMGSVPGLVANVSLLIARIDIAGIVTPSLPLPVLPHYPKVAILTPLSQGSDTSTVELRTVAQHKIRAWPTALPPES